MLSYIRLPLTCLLATLVVASFPLHGWANESTQDSQEALVEQARQLIATSRELSGDAQARRLEAARALLDKAERALTDEQKKIDDDLQKIGVVLPTDTEKAAARERLHADQLRIRLALATLPYELAKSFPADSHERNAALDKSIAQFDSLIEQRSDFLGGQYAKLGRALCLRESGRNGEAFAVFEELLAQADEPPEFHALRTQAAVEAMQTAMLPDVKKYKPALDIAHAWIAASTKVSQPAASDLAIRFLGGEAALAYVEAIGRTSAEQEQRSQQELHWAREQFAEVAHYAGPSQSQARSHLLDPALGGESAKEPGTFVEARDYARAALDRMTNAEAELHDAGRNGDPATHSQRQQRMATARDEAMRYCHAALRMRTNETPLDDLATVRYYLAFAEYKAGQFEDAAALGAELSKSSSQRTAREASKVALASYDAIYHAATTEPARAAALSHLQILAGTIVQRWGSRGEVDDARLVLLEAAISQGKVSQAENILNQISADSSLRGDAELTYALGLWMQYRTLVDRRITESEPAAAAQRLQDRLRQGLERVRPRIEGGLSISQTVAAAVVALAELDLDLGQTDDALLWLEDSKLGLMSLVSDKSLIAARDHLLSRSWAVALRVDVELDRREQAANAWQNLEASIRRENDGQSKAIIARQLTRTAISLGRDVEREMQQSLARHRAEQASRIASVWADLFAASAQNSPDDRFFRQALAAEVFRGLAAAFDPGGLTLPAEAERHYRLALAAYKTLIARSENRREGHADYAPAAEAVLAFRIRAAACSRRLGDYRQSLSLILPVIDQNPNLVDAQVEAAYIYQSWGDDNSQYFPLAIDGGQRYREIWGWRELAQCVESRKGFEETFFEARYNLALCRFRQAQGTGDRAERHKLLISAKGDIISIQRLHPDMGGSVWYDKYNELLRRIQRLGDDPPIGLPPTPQN